MGFRNCSSFNLTILILFVFLILPNTVHLLELTIEEKDALDKFRPIADKLTYKDYMKTDFYLIRYLRAKDLNVDTAAEMLKKTMAWRKANQMDTILEEDFSLYDNHWRVIFPGSDKQGRPIAISLFGMYDIRKFIVGGKLPQILRYFDRMQELAATDLRRRRMVEPNGENITDTVAIIDMTGFNLRQQACLQCLSVVPHMFRNLESHYPGFFHRVFLINTPTTFLPVLEIVRPFLSKATAEALKVFGHNKDEWKAALLNEIPPDHLPIQYGGTKYYDTFHSDWRKDYPEVSALLGKKS